MGKNKLSRASQRKVAGIMDTLGSIVTLAAQIDEGRVRELVRRSVIPVARDGFPAGSMPEHSSGGHTADPTGNTAAGHVDHGDPRPDHIIRSLRAIERQLRRAEKNMVDAVGVLDVDARQLDKKKERSASDPCEICLVQPAEKSGWCLADYTDWHHHGSPDRLIWKLWKQKAIADDGSLMVPECPPPTRQAIRGPHREVVVDTALACTS